MIDWDTCIKPLLGGPIASPPGGFTEDGLEAIVKAVSQHSKQILEHDSKHECFYSSYIALVGHYIANCFHKVPKPLFKDFMTACQVVMEFCLLRLQNFDVLCAVPQKNLMQLVSALILGISPFLRVDVITFTAMLRSAEIPMVVRKSDASSQPEDKVTDVIDQMSEAFDVYSSGLPVNTPGRNVDKDILMKENISALIKLSKTHDFDQIYRNLQYLKRYFNRLSDLVQGKSMTLPDSPNAAATIRSGLGPLSSNISVVLQAVTLPLAEPLTKSKIENFSRIGLGCLYAGLSVVAAMSVQPHGKSTQSSAPTTTGTGKEPDYQSVANGIVQEVFAIHSRIEEIFGSQGRADSTLRSYRSVAAYIISKGLNLIINQQKVVGKDAHLAINPFILALSKTLTITLRKLLENLEPEDNSELTEFSPDLLDVKATNLTESQLFAILKECDAIQILVTLVQLCLDHDNVGTKHADVKKNETDDSGASDDDNLDREDLTDNEYSSSCEDVQNSAFDAERGPLLGEWFLQQMDHNEEETSSRDPVRFPIPPPPGSRQKFILPDEAFIKKDFALMEGSSTSEIITEILNLLNFRFFSSKSSCMRQFLKKNLKHDTVIQLTSLVAKNNKVIMNSHALMSLMHNMLSSGFISDDMETAILKELKLDDPQKCLFAESKSLSILFKILFRHQVLEKAKDKDYSKTEEFTKALLDHYSKSDFEQESMDIENVSVVVVQMCLFLFHTLTENGKSDFLGRVIDALLHCDEKDKIPHKTSRLTMILEYLLMHYSQPAKHLFAHTQWNLIRVFLEPDISQAPAAKIANSAHIFTPFSFEKENPKSATAMSQPTSDADYEMQVVDVDETFFEVSDVTTGKNKENTSEIDSKVLEVLKQRGIEIIDLYHVAVHALNAGGLFKMSSEWYSDPKQKFDKYYLIYNLTIGWRLVNKLASLVNMSERSAESLGECLVISWILGGRPNVEGDTLKEVLRKETDMLCKLAIEMNMPAPSDSPLPLGSFPSCVQILVLDCIVREMLNVWPKQNEASIIPDELFPVVMKYIDHFNQVARNMVLRNSKESEDIFELLSALMRLDFSGLEFEEGIEIDIPNLPKSVQTEVNKWEPETRCSLICDDPKTDNLIKCHLKALNSEESYLTILQFVLQSFHLLLAKISPWEGVTSKTNDHIEAYKSLFAAPTDALMNKFEDTKSLDFTDTSDVTLYTLQYQAMGQIYDFILNPRSSVEASQRKFSIGFLKYLEKMCANEDTTITRVLHQFFILRKVAKQTDVKENPKTAVSGYTGLDLGYSGDFKQLLFAGCSESKEYTSAFFSLLATMLGRSIGEKADSHLVAVVSELNKLLTTESAYYDRWFDAFLESLLLQHLTATPRTSNLPMKLVKLLTHPESPVEHSFALKLLESSLHRVEKMIKVQPAAGFITLLMGLAEAKNGRGHLDLFKQALKWLEICHNEIVSMKNFSSLNEDQANIVNVCELILFYITDILLVLNNAKPEDQYASEYDEEDDDDIIHDDETVVDENEKINTMAVAEYDPDEDEEMCNKLCTYTVTQKEFMNQHWYHCHTCSMTDGIGVCTVCAKVCHKGHDLTYAKFGSFFCDCGAKGNSVCKALTERDRVIQKLSTRNASAASSNTTLVTSVSTSAASVELKKPAPSVPVANRPNLTRRLQKTKRMKLCKNLDGCKKEILEFLSKETESSLGLLLNILTELEKHIDCKDHYSMMPNTTAYALKIMEKLHTLDKTTETVETLLVPTLGSQEGAFENVKANFTGEQGQTIRQLINSKVISRVAMSCLSSGSGKRHHLAVSHEKTKLTILQLSALLKQADASKRKLTLTRLSTTHLPFSIVTVSNNPCYEGALAVCGLKDCHVLTFTSGGTPSEHHILHPQLTAGNYIIKAVWLPGSPTEIALVTAKFVTIYNLAEDVLSPTFYLLLPTGKIRDATFLVVDGVTSLIIMSSSGYLYMQPLIECCSAKSGPFYVTSTFVVESDALKEKNDEVGGGGISVYYSHSLQMLFFSYGNGKNFAATLNLESSDYKVSKLFAINFKPSSNGKSNGNSSLALHAWNEIVGHPGLLTCFTHSSGVPVAVMVEPESITLQELKSSSTKAKIQDLVAVRHASPGDVERSTVIALCEDGSLKIYLASSETTGFWLQPSLQPRSVFRRQSVDLNMKGSLKNSSEAAKSKDDQVEKVFPVDFFEDCQLIGPNDLEFGGDSLLQVYNPEQIKNRLASQDMYIVSKRTYSIEIGIKSKNLIVTGIRMQVGSRGSDFAPTHIYIGDRYVSLGPRLKKPRWFDFPLTREESIRYRSKLVITCGCSVHPHDYNIIDSIKVYGKTKEVFAWVEEEAKEAAEAQEKSPPKEKVVSQAEPEPEGTHAFIPPADISVYMTPADRLIHACLASLNCTFSKDALSATSIGDNLKSRILDFSGRLLVLNLPHDILRQLKQLMMNALPNTTEYHNFKDNTILKHVAKTLHRYRSKRGGSDDSDSANQTTTKYEEMQSDEYQSLLMELSRVAVRRPRNLLSTNINLEWPPTSERSPQENCIYISDLWDILLELMKRRPSRQQVSPPCLPGIQSIESTVQALVDIIHSTAMTIPQSISGAVYIYYSLLTNENIQVSSAARSALIRLLCFPELNTTEQKLKVRTARSNSKSTDSAPSTRSNSPPSTFAPQSIITTSANTAGGIPLAPSQIVQSGLVDNNPSLMEELREYGLLKDDGSGDSDGEEFDDDDDDDDDEDDDDDDDADNNPHLVNDAVIEERGNGIAPSLNRDEQLRAMQALEENVPPRSQEGIGNNDNNNDPGGASGGAAGQSQQGNDSPAAQMQSEMQRLQEIMHASENPNFFVQDDSSFEDMIMDVHDEEFPGFEGDDEAMVEYAIALSLQQSGENPQQGQHQPPSGNNENNDNNPPQNQHLDQLMHAIASDLPQLASDNQEANVSESQSHYVELGGSKPADTETEETAQGTSADDSLGNTLQCNSSSLPAKPSRPTRDSVFSAEKTESMRCTIISSLLSQFSRIFELKTGQQSVPYFQVLITLTKSLDPTKETQKKLLENVVIQLATSISGSDFETELNNICQRSVVKEVLASVVRCLVILMSEHEHKDDSASNTMPDSETSEKPETIGCVTAKILCEYHVIEKCVGLLDRMLEHWDIGTDNSKRESPELNKLMKRPSTTIIPDFTPIILPQYVKSHPSDVFESYVVMMTERLLHLPYRFKKFYGNEKMNLPESLERIFKALPPVEGNLGWILSDYMLSTDIPVIKKRVRKALLYLCGTKENYREARDIHALTRYLECIMETWREAFVMGKFGTVNFPYDQLISIVKYLNACLAVATKRTTNWQKSCLSENCSTIGFLLELSIYITEDVAASVLQLLMCAVTVKKKPAREKKVEPSKTGTKPKLRKAFSSDPNEASTSTAESSEESVGSSEMAEALSVKFLKDTEEKDLKAFLSRFLLEINATSVRWNAHEFILQIFRNTNPELRSKLVDCMWQLWHLVQVYGRKCIQFVDLLGYVTINNGLDSEKAQHFNDSAYEMLKAQNVLLVNHPNSMLYMQLSNYVDFDGYFLESYPCLVCNQPEVPYQHIKLASIKADTKFTTTQQIIKLVGSYSVQKVTIKVTDIKQTKMIRTVSLLYNNKKVPAIIELKNKPELWHKAKQIVLSHSQGEIKFDLPLPVVATNLMLEFSDFYENAAASTETLQCPRCSASVQANPGICGNCGENVFQCHKCRSINYDEKDPYLCNVCGFSKYAKFDVTLLARPCCAVDAIENEEDRKKTVNVVSVLLEKADLSYYQLLAYKPELEQLLLQIEKLSTGPAMHITTGKTPSNANNSRAPGNGPYGSRIPVLSSAGPSGNPPTGGAAIAAAAAAAAQGSNVNIHIRQLAQKYCVEAKNSFEELSKIMRTVLASRKEIVEYDQRQRIALAGGKGRVYERETSFLSGVSSISTGNCYGCASATSKQCIVLLRALATNQRSRKRLVSTGLITELVHVSLSRGNASTRKQVQQLISQLVKNDHEASTELNTILLNRITSGMLHYNQDLFPAAISSEMNLLVAILNIQDQCWQSRLRTVVQLFQLSVKVGSPAVMENVTLPCLQMLQSKAAPSLQGDVTSKLIAAAKFSKEITVDAQAWLAGDDDHGFDSWRKNKIKCNVVSKSIDSNKSKSETHEAYLAEKYARKWQKYVLKRREKYLEAPQWISSQENQWLRQMLFCKSSRAVRLAASSIVDSLAENPSRKAQVIDMLTSYLDELEVAGVAGAEFFQMYQGQIRDSHWKVHLAGRGILPFIGSLIDHEITVLLKLEESTLSLDLQRGYSLKELTELIAELVRVPCIRQRYKSSLVGTVLNGYLSLRKLVIQRTTIIDDTQELLLELLEDLTTGTESETKAFMAVCIETINKYELTDIRTPQFIFERLSNIIFPEESNTNEFFMSLDKDPLQEDFLQGRMVGNPYSSNEPGLGPLMRDVKNKICRDCDLVALLEDDSGMELLVNNKIISLDLSVRDVYNKVWLPSHSEDEAMRVVYRMRGLLGEATEDIIDKLDSEIDNRDEEEVYKMAGVLSKCGGVEAMLQRLESVHNLTHGRQLVDAILKLMTYAVHLKLNRKYFLQPELNTLNVLLGTLNLGLQSGEDGVPLVEQLLSIMDRILQETGDDKTQVFTGDKEKLMLLLQQIDSELVRHHSKVLRGLMKIIPFLSFGDPDLMQMLIDHFKSALEFEKFDESHTDEDAIYLDCFCEISTGIEDNDNGDKLKQLIITNDIVNKALMYISKLIPQHKTFESEDWKAFLSRPALPYCLRLLTGLSTKHAMTQELIGQTSIPDLHRLEQVSTEGSIGSLAENVLEAIAEHPDMAKHVKEVRRETRSEKKRLAMAMRQKELGALGMKTNAKGQVVTKTALLEEIGDLVEEAGLTCIICREGYKFEPKKVLGVYTYSRRCPLEEFENKPRKQQGYSTVSHFNVVHYDCHTSAVRAARGREEWESAMLQNANTKCNGLLPLWGPHVPESAFTTCLARHNTYLQEATGYKEPNVTSTAHDLKLLLLRFAEEKSFSEETGGGGPQSNIHLLPYIIHMAQYVINTTRSSPLQERTVTAFLEASKDTWVESSYIVDGPLYVTALSIFVCDGTRWASHRGKFLNRLLVLCQARLLSKSPTSKLSNCDVKPYDSYKAILLFWAMVDLIYNVLFKNVSKKDSSVTWAQTLQSYVRSNDPVLQETSEKMMTKFQQEYLPISTFEEFVDVAELHSSVDGDMPKFMKELFDSLPK